MATKSEGTNMRIDNLLSADAYWSVNKELSRKIGIVNTVFLMELVWARKRFKADEFFINSKELCETLGIGDDQRRTSLRTLENLGFISYKKKGTPARYFYIINDEAIFPYFQTTSEPGDTTTRNSADTTTSGPGDTSTYIKKEIKKEINNVYEDTKKPSTEIYDPICPPTDYELAIEIQKSISSHIEKKYGTKPGQDMVSCSEIARRLIGEGLEAKKKNLYEKIQQFEYHSFWGQQTRQMPTPRKLLKAWDQLTPDNVPVYIQKGFTSEQEYKTDVSNRMEEEKRKARRRDETETERQHLTQEELDRIFTI